ncbi:HBL/NHE enterotoxin family protein [Streptomyces sp. NPDC059009]|uniref:HBL/NHE enterotoxin family protein n=1 Tax=Streptomyces sp. NPDC059009 TaxID=3346694 RepID=UPI0036AEA692
MALKDFPQPVSLADALAKSHGPGQAVQTYVQTIGQTVDMQVGELKKNEGFMEELNQAAAQTAKDGLEALEKINGHLATARTHADEWNSGLLKGMLDTNADVQGYSKEFKTLGGAASQALKDAESGSPEAMKEALGEAHTKLKALQGAVGKRQTKAGGIADSLHTFQQHVAADAVAFGDDKTKVDAVLTGDTGFLNSLMGEIDALNEGINKDNAMIAGGAVAIAAGVVAGVIGGFFIATGIGAGVGLMILGAGVCVAGAGVALVTVAGLDLKKKQGQMAEDQKELTLLKASVASFGSAQKAVAGLADQATAAAAGAQLLYQGWEALGSSLGEVVEILQDAIDAGDPDDLKDALDNTAAFLDSALDDWANVDKATEAIATALSGLQTAQTDIPQVFLAA